MLTSTQWDKHQSVNITEYFLLQVNNAQKKYSGIKTSASVSACVMFQIHVTLKQPWHCILYRNRTFTKWIRQSLAWQKYKSSSDNQHIHIHRNANKKWLLDVFDKWAAKSEVFLTMTSSMTKYHKTQWTVTTSHHYTLGS